ncbi:MAG TPA: DedA family protein [Candidatus Dormibacteraeota bacterium]
MSAALGNLVASYGLLAILVLMAGESCGLPIPSEIVVPVGGVLAATGQLNLGAVILVATLANLIGGGIAYVVTARWGTEVLLGPGRYVGIRRHHVEIADAWFQRHGTLAVLIGRMLPVVRTYISFPAGLARVPIGRFVVFSVIGSIPWNTMLALIGYTLGHNYDRIAVFIQRGGYLVAVLVLVVLVLWWVRGRRAEAEG